MKEIDKLFDLQIAKSSGFSTYEAGDVAFVTNGLRENGVLGFVKPQVHDKIFHFMGITISAFGICQ